MNGVSAEARSDTFRLSQGQRVFIEADVLSANSVNEFGLNGAANFPFFANGTLNWKKYAGYAKIATTGNYYFYAVSAGGGANDSMRLDNVFVGLAPDSATPSGAAGSTDSGLVARIGKRMWGIALGLSGSDSTTVAQRTVTATLSSLGSGPYNVRIFALDSATGAAVQGYTFSIKIGRASCRERVYVLV